MVAFSAESGYCNIPSRQHEARRSMLETVATLAGFTTPVTLPLGVIPDVARTSLQSRAMFIGEAKQSETPMDIKATGRIENYMRWLARRPRGDSPDLFCVCHPVHHGAAWLPILVSISDAVGLDKLTGGTTTVSYDAAFTWVVCSGRG